MYLYKYAISKDNAWEVLNLLGKTEIAHLIDMNKFKQSYELHYIEMIKRCEESQRRLEYSYLEF